MTYTYEELKHKTVAQLREIAAGIEEHEAVQGYTQLNKEHLLAAICQALHIEMHAHHEAKGIDKATLKAQIKALKKERETALAAHDHTQLKTTRRRLHEMRRQIKRATV